MLTQMLSTIFRRMETDVVFDSIFLWNFVLLHDASVYTLSN